MTPLHDTLNDLEEKAKKAKACGPLLPDNFGRAWDAYAELHGVCTPDTVLALITALREAGEALKRIENPVLRGRPSYADWELRLIARDWRAKYAKGEK